MIKGKTIEEVLAISDQMIVEALGGLPPAKIHCSILAEKAIRAAVLDYQKKKEEEACTRKGVFKTMMGRESCLRFIEAVVQGSPADQTEGLLLTEDSSLTRFARFSIHQHVAERNGTLILRVVLGKRIAVVTTNILHPFFNQGFHRESDFPGQGSTSQRCIYFSAGTEVHS